MVRCNAINEADKELYKYALYSFSALPLTNEYNHIDLTEDGEDN